MKIPDEAVEAVAAYFERSGWVLKGGYELRAQMLLEEVWPHLHGRCEAAALDSIGGEE